MYEEGIRLLSKIKQLLDDHKREPLANEQLALQELQKLQAENERLQENITSLREQTLPPRLHLEFFYYHVQANAHEQYTEQQLDHFPIMAIAVHFMDEIRAVPYWLQALLSGLEQTLHAMRTRCQTVKQKNVFSLFVDTKVYPQQEVRRVLQYAVKQLQQLQQLSDNMMTVHVHVGGDDLYDQLLETYAQYTRG